MKITNKSKKCLWIASYMASLVPFVLPWCYFDVAIDGIKRGIDIINLPLIFMMVGCTLLCFILNQYKIIKIITIILLVIHPIVYILYFMFWYVPLTTGFNIILSYETAHFGIYLSIICSILEIIYYVKGEFFMKKMSKLFGVIGFMMILCFGCFTNTVKAASNTDYTMDDVKQMLDAYLEENHPNIVFGTDEYTEYLVEQLVEGTDENLKLDSNAELMMDFASIYLYEIDDPSINTYSMQSKTNYDSFKNKTLEELIEEIAEDEKKISNEPAPIDSIGPAAKYNISNATSYAKKWANSFNPNYKQQSSDCTNFVSQILSAGSLYGIIPQHNLPSGMTSDTSYWYYINSKQMSTSFIRVADFYTFYSTRVSKTDTASKTSCH